MSEPQQNEHLIKKKALKTHCDYLKVVLNRILLEYPLKIIQSINPHHHFWISSHPLSIKVSVCLTVEILQFHSPDKAPTSTVSLVIKNNQCAYSQAFTREIRVC